MKKRAFTLAEILITLGIIGIIAALTLPPLITKYEKMKAVIQLKRFYSLLTQAVKRAEVDHGPTETWNWSMNSADFYVRYFKPYLNITEEYINKPFKYKPIKCLNGSSCIGAFGYSAASTPKFILNDGTIISFISTSWVRLTVNFDGFKGPNRVGRDMFGFSILPAEGVVPWGYKEPSATYSFGDKYDRDVILNSTSRHACNKRATSGWWCAALIMADGWEIKDDYPW